MTNATPRRQWVWRRLVPIDLCFGSPLAGLPTCPGLGAAWGFPGRRVPAVVPLALARPAIANGDREPELLQWMPPRFAGTNLRSAAAGSGVLAAAVTSGFGLWFCR
jgi:hypothetical protein